MDLVQGFLVFFSAVCFISEVSSSVDIVKFFPQISGNLTKVTWARSLNNKTIDTVLKDGNILMIKADIDLDEKDKKNLLVDHSNLTLQVFLEKVKASNTEDKIKAGKGKGIKLDFKTIEALTKAKEFIEDAAKEKYPLWLSADILKGPGNPKEDPLNSTEFLTNAQNFDGVVLSLGWVTTNTSGGYYYKDSDIEAMKAIVDKKVNNTLTFPVRASLAALSSSQLKSLLSVSNTSTLTIFSGADDTVDAQKLRRVILDIGVENVFLDVPEDLEENLRLDSKSRATTIVISLLSLALCISAVHI